MKGVAIHPLDLIIIVFFLAAFVGYGLWQGRQNRTAEDYFLGNRTLPWVVAMFSIVATETSVLTFVSVPGLAYRQDWFFLQLALGYIAGRILVSLFLLPQYFATGVTSIYEVLGLRFGSGIQKIASAVFLVTRVLADGVRFLATAVVVQAITGWPLALAVLVIGGVTLAYTLLGGIRTVVWVDSIQFVIYLLGAALSIYILLDYLDSPLPQIWGELAQAGKLRLFHWHGDFFSDPWLALTAIFGGVLLSFAAHGTDHMLVQRALVCRDLSAARKAMIGSGLFAFFQFALFLAVGSLIFLFFKGRELPKDREFTCFIVDHLPVGVKGFLLAGVLSAAMSTLSSSINALASSTLMDWFKKGATLGRSRAISLFWAIVLMAMALVFDESDHAVVELGLQIASFTYGGLLGLFLLSRSKRTFHAPSLIFGLVSSLLLVLYMKHLGMAWTWFIGAGAAANWILSHLMETALRFKNDAG
ncbi:MAG: sodium:solute symporter [Planctomycetota bacterium]